MYATLLSSEEGPGIVFLKCRKIQSEHNLEFECRGKILRVSVAGQMTLITARARSKLRNAFELLLVGRAMIFGGEGQREAIYTKTFSSFAIICGIKGTGIISSCRDNFKGAC